jgi:NADH:ubiquinone oxidoreductase subunit 3 (subunit A)
MKAALIALSALVVVLVAVRWVLVVYWHSLAASSATRSTPSSYESPKRAENPVKEPTFGTPHRPHRRNCSAPTPS